MGDWRINHYLVAASSTAAAVVLSSAFAEAAGSPPRLSAVLFSASVVVASWLAGTRAALSTIVLAALALAFLFLEPIYSLRIERAGDVLLFTCFAGAGVLGTWLCNGRASQVERAPRRAAGDRPRAAHLIFFAAAYVLAGGFGQTMPLIPGVAITFWPPAGIFVAALLLNRRSHWPWYVVGACLAELTCNEIWFDNPFPSALVYFTANALEALAAAWLLGRFGGSPFRLDSPWQVAVFVGLGAGVAPIVGATIIATTDALLGKHPFLTAWPLVWLGDGTGLLMSTPIALALGQAWRARRRISGRRVLEATTVFAILLGIEAMAFLEVLPNRYLTMPLVLWAAIRFELRGAAAALALIAVTAAMFTAKGIGEFAGPPEQLHAKVVTLQTFLGVNAVLALLAATLSYLHRQAVEALEIANHDLERRVDERTASLARERTRLEIALRTGLTGFSEWNLRDGSIHWSPETFPLFGVEPGSFASTMEAFLALVHPDDRDELRTKNQASIAGQGTLEHEYRIVRPDASIRWIHSRSRVEVDAHGNPTTVMGVVTDVTRRKQTELALRVSEARLLGILQQSPAGIVQTDATCRMTVVNHRWCAMLGYSESELLGKSVLDVTHASSVQPTSEAVLRLAAGGQDFSIEKTYSRRDGSLLRAQSNVAALRAPSGEYLGLIAVVTDISERLLMEEALRQSEHFLRTIADVMPGILSVFDLADGQTVFINRSVTSLLGFSPEDIKAMGMDVVPALMHPDDLLRFALHLARVRALADGEVADFEHRMRDRTGNWHWFQRHDAIFTRDASGGPPQIISVATESTERKRAEEATARLAAIVESSSDAIVSTDPQGSITSWNLGARALLEFSAQEIVGQPILRLIPPARHATEMEILARVQNGEAVSQFETVRLRRDGSAIDVSVRISSIKDGSGVIVGTSQVARDITERKAVEAHKTLLMAEVNHRAKNLLSVVQAVARFTAGSGDPETLVTRLSERIAGLAASHDLLVKNRWTGIEVSDLVKSQLSHFEGLLDERIMLEGPPTKLNAAAAQAIGMAFHELSTNAGKYGALANDDGCIRISWRISGETDPEFVLSWLEEGVPILSPPGKGGFGQVVITQMVEQAVEGKVELDYRSNGVFWRLIAPLRRLQEVKMGG